jgi:hypothetical protein
VILVLRALSVLALVDLSGLTHAALDIVGSEHADDCEEHECPPGCANCHCWHAGLAAPPLARQEAPQLMPALATASLPPPAYDRTQPQAPDTCALYRPPRALALG